MLSVMSEKSFKPSTSPSLVSPHLFELNKKNGFLRAADFCICNMQFSGEEEEILTFKNRNYGIIVLLLSDNKSMCHYAERQLSQQITENYSFCVLCRLVGHLKQKAENGTFKTAICL